MQQFIAKHQDQVSGALSGFDRLVFRGTLRSIAHAAGMNQYLCSNDILLQNFGSHVEQVSQRLKTASLAEAEAARRPVRTWLRLRSARRTSLAASVLKMGSPMAWYAC